MKRIKQQARDQARAVLTLLDDGRAWTRNVYARDSHGQECGSDSSLAAKWCLVGACYKLGLYELIPEMEKHVPVALKVSEWQDVRTWPDIRDLLLSIVGELE